MKYCVHCGNELADGAVFCTKCGRAVNGGYAGSAQTNNSPSALSIVGFVFSFIVPLVGLICSIVAFTSAKSEDDMKSRNFAKAGIIISAVIMGLEILSVVLYYGFWLLIVFGIVLMPY